MAHKLPQASAAPIPFGEADTAEGARSAVVHPFPLGDTPYRPYIRPHRLAQTTADEEMIAALFEGDEDELYNRLRAGSPYRPPVHVGIGRGVHWTTWPLTIAGVCIALIFVGQLVRDHLERLF